MIQRFNYGLNGLRGVACIVVLLFHCCIVFRVHGMQGTDNLALSFPNIPVTVLHIVLALLNGPACVTMFFVLSGVVLSLTFRDENPTRAPIVLSYWLKRLSRLYPLLILSVVVSAGLQFWLFRHEQFRTLTAWFDSAYQVDLSPKDLFRNLVGASSSLNSPAWSIKIEILESLIFPAIYILSRRPVVAVVTLLALLALMVTAHGNGSTLDDMRLDTICFFVGALIPRWSAPVATSFARLPLGVRSTIIVASVAVFCFSEWVSRPVALGSFLQLITATFIIIVVYHRPAGPVAKSVFVRSLGEMSYSIYLLHMPVLMTVVYVLLSVTGNPAELPWAPATIALAIVTLLVTLPVAYFSYTYFERPIERAGRRMAARIHPRAATSVLVATNPPGGIPQPDWAHSR